jgi:DNA-3-methyladenine glycosylase
MFKQAGHLYVYFTYGMHWCANIVAGSEGFGEGILIRALEPVEGLELMAQRRNTSETQLLCSGPARAAQAMGISKAQDGAWLGGPELTLEGAPYNGPVMQGPRIGISAGQELNWRFWIPDSPFLSRKNQK